MNVNRHRYPLTAALLHAIEVEREPLVGPEWARRYHLAATLVYQMDSWRAGHHWQRPWWHADVKIPSVFT